MPKKKPEDYPLFSCRMSKEDKEEIDNLLNRLVDLAEKVRKEDDYKKRKNHFVSHVLKQGLAVLEKRYESKIANKSKKKKSR